MAAKRDSSYERTALRWLARFVSEVPAVTTEEAQLAGLLLGILTLPAADHLQDNLSRSVGVDAR